MEVSLYNLFTLKKSVLSKQQAEQLGREDQQRLHRNKKLVLMVDLDQTLIHTTDQHCQQMSNKVRFITYVSAVTHYCDASYHQSCRRKLSNFP